VVNAAAFTKTGAVTPLLAIRNFGPSLTNFWGGITTEPPDRIILSNAVEGAYTVLYAVESKAKPPTLILLR
jgi:hypothetical protein